MCFKVYSVLGLLMVGTFNLEKDRILDKQMNNYWPSKSNPSFHGVVDSSLTTTNVDQDGFHDNIQYHEDIHDVDISNDDLKEYEKKRSIKYPLNLSKLK